MASIMDQNKFKFEAAITHFKNELNNIRTGRANPALVENLPVDYYGTKTPLIQLAAISTPDSRSIFIQPWDKNSIKDIEKAIQASSLGLNPVNEGQALRIPIPPLTEERRQDLIKIIHQKMEEAKIAIRNTREEIWRSTKEQKNSGSISEDDMFVQQKDLQKIIDEYNLKLKDLTSEKEKEIMTI